MEQYDIKSDDRIDPYWNPEQEIDIVPDPTIFDLLVQSVSHEEFNSKCVKWNLPCVIRKIDNDKWIGITQVNEQYLEVYFMY